MGGKETKSNVHFLEIHVQVKLLLTADIPTLRSSGFPAEGGFPLYSLRLGMTPPSKFAGKIKIKIIPPVISR